MNHEIVVPVEMVMFILDVQFGIERFVFVTIWLAKGQLYDKGGLPSEWNQLFILRICGAKCSLLNSCLVKQLKSS